MQRTASSLVILVVACLTGTTACALDPFAARDIPCRDARPLIEAPLPLSATDARCNLEDGFHDWTLEVAFVAPVDQIQLLVSGIGIDMPSARPYTGQKALHVPKPDRYVEGPQRYVPARRKWYYIAV